MSKSVAPIYTFNNLCTLTPSPEKPGGYHYVVQLKTEGPLREWPIVEDYGIEYRQAEPDSGRWTAESIQRANTVASLAREQAEKLNVASFAAHIKGNRFTRHVIGHHYVTVHADEVERLASIFKTPTEQIKITPDLEILHVSDEFTFWSDGKITKSPLGELPPGGSLSDSAVNLIKAVRGADGGTVHLPGGLLALTKIKKIHESRAVAEGPSRGHYAAETITEYDVEWVDGSRSPIYCQSAGYFEGYAFDIYAERPLLGGTPGPEGITEFPADDFSYDPALGYVAKDAD